MIHWFRQDLRIQDNPSLSYLTKNYDNIVCVFILDEINCDRIIGSASKVWLYNALKDLNDNEGAMVLSGGQSLVPAMNFRLGIFILFKISKLLDFKKI